MRDRNPKEVAGWVAEVRRGDRDSAARLVEHYSRSLIAMAYRYTRDWEASRDLTQETWLKVFRALDRFRGDAPFGPWLFAIHRNGCLSHWRHVKRRPDVPLVQDGPEHPGQVAERHAFWETVMEAKQRLSPRQQEVFALVDLEGLRPSEAARVLEMPATTLRVHLHAARHRLAGLLKKKEIRP